VSLQDKKARRTTERITKNMSDEKKKEILEERRKNKILASNEWHKTFSAKGVARLH
jgi:hypothetical protein